MKKLIPATALLLVLAACSPAPEPDAAGGSQQDYRQMLDHARQRRASEEGLQVMRDAIRKFQVDLGRFPTNLPELVTLGYLDVLPEPPKGATCVYNAEFGNIAFVKDSQGGAQR